MQPFRKKLLKWTIYALILLGCYVLQATPQLLELFDTKAAWLLVAAVLISVHEDAYAAIGIGTAAGLLWDFSAGRLFGFNGLIVMLLCTASALLVAYLIQLNVLNAVLITFSCVLLHGLLDFFFNYSIWGYPHATAYLWSSLFPIMLYSVVVSVPMYYGIGKFATKMNKKQGNYILRG